MTHKFDTKIAAEYGLAEALLLDYLHFLVLTKTVWRENEQGGRYYAVLSAEHLSNRFWYIEETAVNAALKHLCDVEIVEALTNDTGKYYLTISEKGWRYLKDCGYRTPIDE